MRNRGHRPSVIFLEIGVLHASECRTDWEGLCYRSGDSLFTTFSIQLPSLGNTMMNQTAGEGSVSSDVERRCSDHRMGTRYEVMPS